MTSNPDRRTFVDTIARSANIGAKSLSIHSNEGSKTIAYELGFENKPYFSKCFKNRTGFSPKEFTKRNVH